MASSSQNCGVCDLRHINKPSIIWCTECDEGLCQECQEHHSLSKGSRNHNTIAITEYQTLPNDVLKITQYCNIHKDKFIIYCRKHERPCCRKCIVETHKEC
ncbi:blast:Transcription intermediary factor 1-beta [Mytilus galloprovincialis]|uniref:Blast:Transcription intermediary factor 1-beta n=1 Tax=Mytilus galloprovincialis TaxID=29158 RepID=A0A8B6E116_MYTGA|nr:blast:Transcription intermediary factor 1-beta [Mytilus galloprovincialis]